MKKNSYVNILVIFTAFVILINLPVINTNPIAKSVRSAAIMSVYPVQYISYSIFTGAGHIISSIIDLKNAQKENEILMLELKQERAINSVFESLLKDNNNLRRSLNFKGQNPYHFSLIPAEVISRSPSNWFNVIEINKGLSDGVKEGKAVISEKGLVGRTIEVFKHMSKVLLITDSSSSISGVLKRTNHLGIIAGMQESRLVMEFIPHSADVKEKDVIVTSGISDFFPKGIPVGFVSKIEKKDFDLFQNIEIESLEDISKVNRLFIVK